MQLLKSQTLNRPPTRGNSKAPRVGFVLKAHNNIIRVPQNDDVTFGFSPSPALGPEIEDVV